MVSAMLEEAAGDITVLDELILDHESLLKKYPDSEFAPTLMFQLAELHYERAQLLFQQDMATFEDQLASYQDGDTSVEPSMPTLSMDKTIYYCSSLIEKYPKLKYRDKVIYKLAIAYLDAGEHDNARANFELLTREYPDSPIALEAHFRIGEYYFDHRQFEEAIVHYNLLLNHWDNPYYSMALYKLGWSEYNLAHYSQAISTFLALIEDINLVESLETPEGALSKMDLRTESIHYIASSFTEQGGTTLARDFFLSMKEKEYTVAILRKMAELYENRNSYADAIASYRVLLEFYPYHQNAPDFYTHIVADYEAAHDMNAANRVREEIVTYFGPGSQWLQRFKEGELHKSGLFIARENLVHLGTFYQAQAQQEDSLHLYHVALTKYQEYIAKFPHQDNTSEIHYFLAECYYRIKEYDRAAEAYYDVVTRYPESEYREKAAFNRIFSYVQKQGLQKATTPDTIAIVNFIGTGDTIFVVADDPAVRLVLNASNDFCTNFQQSTWLDQVYMKYGEVLNEIGAYLYAVDVYKKVIELQPPSQHKLAAAISAGQSYFDGGFYKKAQDWFSTIPKVFPDSIAQVNRARRLASSAQFKIAEQLSSNGQSSQAAAVLLAIADSSQETAFRERALFEAATQQQKAGTLENAARTFERLAATYPHSELSDKAFYHAGTIRESTRDWLLAAADYLKLFDAYPESALREQALKNAALCYENASDWLAAKNTYRRYVENYSDNYIEILEFIYKSGEMAYKANQKQDAKLYFAETVRTFNRLLLDGFSLDNYFVAQAQFMIGEILYADYVRLDLVPPFEQNLKIKVEAFTAVVKAYTEAIKYQIADWSTASSHRIGMCFEEFVRAFIEAPIPDHLDEEQRQLYQNKLAERARPYKERALETYSKNVEQAEAYGIDNSWVASSRLRVQALRQELQFGETDKSTIKGSL